MVACVAQGQRQPSGGSASFHGHYTQARMGASETKRFTLQVQCNLQPSDQCADDWRLVLVGVPDQVLYHEFVLTSKNFIRTVTQAGKSKLN